MYLLNIKCAIAVINDGYLKFDKIKILPNLENVNFKSIIFIDINSDLESFRNVTCNNMVVLGKFSNFKSPSDFFRLGFKSLLLKDINEDLIKKIFETGSNRLEIISLNRMTFSKFDHKFDNFPSLRSVYLGGYPHGVKI